MGKIILNHSMELRFVVKARKVEGMGWDTNLDIPDRKLGSMVRINGLFHLAIHGVYWGYNPLILTIDPNFLGHPRRHHFF